ncbi:MAG: YncE family protein [Burkholderiales bacterium]
MAVIGALTLAAGPAAAQAPLELQATIEMPGVKGRIDHFAVDMKGHRLFIAALGNNTVEVLDIAANKHVRSIAGFGEPQGIAYVQELDRLYVASGTANRVDVLDGQSLKTLQRISGMDDADNVRFDAAAKAVIVGYGKGALRLLAADTALPLGEIRLAGHPESFQLEASGSRIFVNVPTAHQVAVVDRMTRTVLATWPVTASRNFPMALDEKGRRLFVGARSPALLLIYDTDSGANVAKVPIGGDTDDVYYDVERARIYVICGAGRIDVLRRDTPDRYTHEASIKSAPGARTGFFMPPERHLYVAAPAAGSTTARVLVYRVE